MIAQPKTTLLDIPTFGTDKTHKIAVYEWANPLATEIVFCVHGLTRNGRDFDVLATALSEEYRVIAIDVAGRGKSQWHTDARHYNYGDYVADIIQVLVQLGITKLHWIGTSMGGIIGMMIANSAPQLFKTLILNDIGCLIPAEGLKRILTYVGKTEFATRAEAENELRIRCSLYGIESEEHWQNLFDNFIEKTGQGAFRFAYDPQIISTFPPADKIEDINLWALWEKIKTIPTLLIRGEKSDLLTHETAILMQKSHPNFSLLEVAEAGHAPALMSDEQVKTIEKTIERFSHG